MAERKLTQATKTCSVEGCSRPHRCRGLCGMHYSRTRKMGNPGGDEVTVLAPGEPRRVAAEIVKEVTR